MNNYIFQAFVAIVAVQLVMALFGCCVARIKDKCSVGLFSLLMVIVMLVTLGFGSVFLVLETQDSSFFDNFCTKNDFSTESSNVLQQFASLLSSQIAKISRAQIDEIDHSLTNGLSRYMCKKDCECDPLFFEHVLKWSPEQRR